MSEHERMTCKKCNNQTFENVDIVDLEAESIEATCTKCNSKEWEFRPL